MAIRTMSLGEALENGYEVIGPDPIYREEATGFETATSIGLEVIPALIGGIGFGLAGGAGVQRLVITYRKNIACHAVYRMSLV